MYESNSEIFVAKKIFEWGCLRVGIDQPARRQEADKAGRNVRIQPFVSYSVNFLIPTGNKPRVPAQ